MEQLKLLSVHSHPLLPFTRFYRGTCNICWSGDGYLYGGYICNEVGCNAVFHSKCAELVPEINHSSHPDHPLKLVLTSEHSSCSLCGAQRIIRYSCSICDFRLHLGCAMKHISPSLVHFKVHGHPLQLSNQGEFNSSLISYSNCKVCDHPCSSFQGLYQCLPCNLLFHMDRVEGYHISHPKHPLKFLRSGPPDYSDKKCLLCGEEFGQDLHHCDVCNFSICRRCLRNPPPLGVVSPTTHEHTLHLVPRIIDFTCNACGTRGDRSPYFCLQCNFMIHRDCIDLPRVININRHDHRISYISHLGYGNWTCGVCRKNVDGFYGGYLCSKCPGYVVHSRCATRGDVWDNIELEGTPEEAEELEPFQVIDDQTIKHFSHGHNLKLNKDGKILQESILCEACVFQIQDDPFYKCEQCDFILHETCAHLRPKKRHVANRILFTLEIELNKDSREIQHRCDLCIRYFTGFKYTSKSVTLDVRCGSFSEPFRHESHPHPLYYKLLSRGRHSFHMLCCDECPFTLNFWWAFLPKKLMNKRYDDHPLLLSYGETNLSLIYWCDVCEKKLNPKEWFYTCDACGITLHVSCVVGDFSYHKPGNIASLRVQDGVVVANTFIRRPTCFNCGSRCILPSIIKVFKLQVDIFFCSQLCFFGYFK